MGTLLDEFRRAERAVKRWPKWKRVMLEREREADAWFNRRRTVGEERKKLSKVT